MKCQVFAYLSLVFFALPLHGEVRTFTDDTGRTVDAELIGMRGEYAVLQVKGRAGRWPVKRLSPSDQIYVRQWQRNPPKTARVSVRIWEREGIGESGTFESQSSSGLPKINTPIQSTEEKAKYKHYDVDLTNPADFDANKLTMAYVLYVIGPDGRVGAESDNESVPTIEAGKRVTLKTKGITYVSTKTTSLKLGIRRDGSVTGAQKTSRASERFGGAWVRVYAPDGSVVGEAKELHPELERVNPAWIGRTEDEQVPVLASFEELLKEIKENLPKPPAGLPEKPPGFPKIGGK
ncbi:MAG: hypothetical protein AAGA58_13060 [Verrucomicrobiota bacterium]